VRILGFLVVVLVGVAGLGCEGPSCDREPALTYENWGQAYLSTYCTGCHSALVEGEPRKGATVGVDFNTYGDVLAHVERIEARGTGAAPTMPPSGGPSAQEVALLDEWLTCAVYPDAAALEAQ